jgi:HD-like signal output (HDOD) protein
MKPTKNEFLAAIAEIEQLSPAPRVLCRALPLLRDPNCDLRDVVELIKVDTALTADIIRGANSAFYGAGDQVSSLDRAVQKIGLRESFRLLNLAVTHIFAARDLGSYGISADEFWAESLFHGLFLQELARVTGDYDTDTANTIGLLRFIGRLAINQSIADLGAGLFWRAENPLEEWELDSVGFTQSYAAAVLLRAWHFPEELCEAIEYQNEPEKAAASNWLAQALAFSSQVVPLGTWEEIESRGELAAVSRFAQRYDLSADHINGLVAAARSGYQAISQKLYD